MIGEPINDAECLELVTEAAAVAVEGEPVAELARRFETTEELASWIRSLPQRNDGGDAGDGPRVACDVPQRLRLPADDPNCVERSALYIAVAEQIEPRPVRRLATIATPTGRHTFPVEDGLPVRLDPAVPRNALDAGLLALAEFDPIEDLDAIEALEWILSVAEEPAEEIVGGSERLDRAWSALDDLETGGRLDVETLDDLGFAVELAVTQVALFGLAAAELVAVGAAAIARLAAGQRNARRISVRDRRRRRTRRKADSRSSIVSRLSRVGARVGIPVATQLVKAKLGALGIAPVVIGAVERELNREGLSLGMLAAPAPAAGTLAALTTAGLLAGSPVTAARTSEAKDTGSLAQLEKPKEKK